MKFKVTYQYFHPADSSKDFRDELTLEANDEQHARQMFYLDHSGSFHSISRIEPIG